MTHVSCRCALSRGIIDRHLCGQSVGHSYRLWQSHHFHRNCCANSSISTRASGYYGNRISFISTSNSFGSSRIWKDIHKLLYSRGGLHHLVFNHVDGKRFLQFSSRHFGEKGSSKSDVKKHEHFILSNSEISRDHLTPEIALRLMTPTCSLWNAPIDEGSKVLKDCGISDPFWAFYWPGGQTLTRCFSGGRLIRCTQFVIARMQYTPLSSGANFLLNETKLE